MASRWWTEPYKARIDGTHVCRTGKNMTECADRLNGGVRHIVVHYTGGKGTAANNCDYFNGGNRGASADFFIDKDGTICRYNPNCRHQYTWHCGDGHGYFGIDNAHSIGIEVCSSGEAFTTAQKKSLRYLVRKLMEKYGVKGTNVVRHYDASRKQCPAPYAGSAVKNAKWETLRKHITRNY